jgi:hypothetical protein
MKHSVAPCPKPVGLILCHVVVSEVQKCERCSWRDLLYVLA